MKRIVRFLSLLAMVAVVVIPGDAGAQTIGIQVNGATVTGTGLTPGGPVVILAGWWFSSRDGSNLTNTWRAGTADGGGSFAATLRLPVPEGALLSVLDVATGRVLTVDAGRPRFTRIAFPERRFRRDANRDVSEIDSPHDDAVIVVMRAGVGAWVQRVGDGGSNDDDGRPDGVIKTNPRNMIPLVGSPAAPEKIKHKDVVLLLDALAGIFASTEVAE